MDPDATLLLLLEACRDNDRDAVLAALDDLTRWIARGGVLPRHPISATEDTKPMRPNFLYTLDDDGEPIPAPDVVTWARWFETADEARQIAIDTIGKVVVSTIFTAINQRFSDNGPPLLYETMIFDGDRRDCEHYATRQEALDGHARLMRLVLEGTS